MAKPCFNQPSNLEHGTMFDTIIYANGPGQYRALGAPLIDILGVSPSTTLVVAGLIKPLKFRYPRGLKLEDFPTVDFANFSLNEQHEWKPVTLASIMSDDMQYLQMSYADVISAIQNAKSVIYLGEPHGSAIYNFERVLELCPPTTNRTTAYYDWKTYSRSELAKVLREPAGLEFHKLTRWAEVKRYFEYNWQRNSVAVFAPAFKRHCDSQDLSKLSKYGLQALYFIRDCGEKGPVKEYQLYRNFSEWPGTGKYEKNSLGSPRSFSSILDQVLELNLAKVVALSSSRPRIVYLTEAGEAFLKELHPGCKDLDLPARIQVWAQEGFEKSKPAIDRYIRTYFGRQMVFTK